MNDYKYLCFNLNWCKRCRLCGFICPTKVIDYDDRGYPFPARFEKCIQCGQCVNFCPDFAIIGVKTEKEKLMQHGYITKTTKLVEAEIDE